MLFRSDISTSDASPLGSEDSDDSDESNSDSDEDDSDSSDSSSEDSDSDDSDEEDDGDSNEQSLGSGLSGRPTQYLGMFAQDGTRLYLVDSGASRHLIPSAILTNDEKKTIRKAPALKFATANGKVKLDKWVDVWVEDLGITVTAYINPHASEIGRAHV